MKPLFLSQAKWGGSATSLPLPATQAFLRLRMVFSSPSTLRKVRSHNVRIRSLVAGRWCAPWALLARGLLTSRDPFSAQPPWAIWFGFPCTLPSRSPGRRCRIFSSMWCQMILMAPPLTRYPSLPEHYRRDLPHPPRCRLSDDASPISRDLKASGSQVPALSGSKEL